MRPRNLDPKDDVAESARLLYIQNKSKMSAREFRDALTKATKSVRGIPTPSIQWNRWTP